MRTAAAIMAVALAAPSAHAQVDDAVRLLRLAPGDAAALSRGEVVTRVHDSEDRTEVNAVAAVRVRASVVEFHACAAEPACFKRNADVVTVGAFGPQPVAKDAIGLILDPRHLAMLQKCRVGRCELRLPEEVIGEVRALPWESGAARGAAEQIVREYLARYAARYAERGNGALPVLADRVVPVASAESTRALVERALPLLDLAPGLRAHVRSFPHAAAPAASYLYWYKERFHRRLLLAVHHVSLASASTPAGEAMVVASKQVAATHYMNSAIEVTAFLPAPGGGGIVAYESRARTDIRPSGFTWIERVLLRRLLRGRLEDQLGALRGRLESSRPATTPP